MSASRSLRDFKGFGAGCADGRRPLPLWSRIPSPNYGAGRGFLAVQRPVLHTSPPRKGDKWKQACVTLFPVEIRSAGADDGPHLTGVLLQEGRAASVRAEVFAPLSVVWGEDGVAVLTEHRGAEVGRAIPSRHPNGEIRIRMPATPAVQSAFTSKKFLSIEFVSLSETRMASGIREIARAYVSAAAMT